VQWLTILKAAALLTDTVCVFPPPITNVGTYNTIQYVMISTVYIFYQFKISIKCLIFLFMTLNYTVHKSLLKTE